MNGYDVARTLRTKLGSKSILIAMTGWGQENDLREAKEAGFDHHVLKPVNFEHLKSLLATCEIQLVQA
jgi:CheY-like chemotaxis protein